MLMTLHYKVQRKSCMKKDIVKKKVVLIALFAFQFEMEGGAAGNAPLDLAVSPSGSAIIQNQIREILALGRKN